MEAIPTKAGFLSKHRTLILLTALILFLPPLAFVFQAVTGDSNFCGRWCPRMFFTWREGTSGHQFWMGWARSFMGVALVLGVLGTTLFFGRHWCSHLCPIGGTTELGSRLVPKFLKIDYSSIPAAPVRYGYLAVYVIAPAIGLGSLCCNYCNFAAVPRMFAAPFSQADLVYFFRIYGGINLLMIIVLGFLAKGGRAYCNFFCPIGALDAVVGKFGAVFGKRVRILQDRCTSCGQCKDVCPTWAINGGDVVRIDQLSCFPCRECERVCPAAAIAYGKEAVPSAAADVQNAVPLER